MFVSKSGSGQPTHQLAVINTLPPPQTLPLLGGRHPVEILGRISFESVRVDFRSPFVTSYAETDQELTKNQLKVDPLQGVGWGVLPKRGEDESVEVMGCEGRCGPRHEEQQLHTGVLSLKQHAYS